MDKCKYRMEVESAVADDGTIYWTAKFPSVNGCVGGGDTPEEAVKEAQENLEVFLGYLEEEGLPLPKEEVFKPEYNGKFALRLAKSTHRKVVERAKDEGVSANAYINGAIEYYLGVRSEEDRMIEEIKRLKMVVAQSVVMQQFSAQASLYNQSAWENQPELVAAPNERGN